MTIRATVWVLILCALAWVGGLAYLNRDKRAKLQARAYQISDVATAAPRARPTL